MPELGSDPQVHSPPPIPGEPATRMDGSPHAATAEAVLDDISRAGIEVRRLDPVGRPRRDLVTHYLADTSHGRCFLKIGRPTTGPLQRVLRALLGRPSLARQVDVLDRLEQVRSATLRFPRVVHSDRSRYVLLQYVEDARPAADGEVPAGIVEALLAFQTLPAPEPFRGVRARLLDASLAPEAHALRRSLPTLFRVCGWRIAWSFLRTMRACRRQQAPLDRHVFVHNDFHHENVLIDPEGRPYLTDFENVVRTRRWLLVDVVHYAAGTTRATIDRDLIRSYLAAARQVPGIRDRLALAPQLRFALLRRVAQHVGSAAAPPHVRASYRSFLERVLLDDESFRSWMQESFE